MIARLLLHQLAELALLQKIHLELSFKMQNEKSGHKNCLKYTKTE